MPSLGPTTSPPDTAEISLRDLIRGKIPKNLPSESNRGDWETAAQMLEESLNEEHALSVIMNPDAVRQYLSYTVAAMLVFGGGSRDAHEQDEYQATASEAFQTIINYENPQAGRQEAVNEIGEEVGGEGGVREQIDRIM